MKANRKFGWVFRKPIPSFLNPVSKDGCWGPPWNPIVVQYIPGLIRVVTPSLI